MTRRLQTTFETLPFPSAAPAQADNDYEHKKVEAAKPGPMTLPGLAARVAEGSSRPTLVRFVNDASLDMGTPEGREAARTIQASQALKDLFGYANDDLCIACKFFRLISVDVSGVAPSACAVVNRATPPAAVVLDAEGKVVQVLGPGKISKRELVGALSKALQPKVGVEQVIAEERAVIRDVLKLDTLKANLDSKRKELETAKGSRSEKLEQEVKKLEADIAGEEASIQAREDKLFPKA